MKDPSTTTWSQTLGNIFRQQGDYKTALVFYKQVVLANPNSVLAYSSLATTLIKLDSFEEARHA
jgi:tetratricopeptide (TPR) repeat protein